MVSKTKPTLTTPNLQVQRLRALHTITGGCSCRLMQLAIIQNSYMGRLLCILMLVTQVRVEIVWQNVFDSLISVFRHHRWMTTLSFGLIARQSRIDITLELFLKYIGKIVRVMHCTTFYKPYVELTIFFSPTFYKTVLNKKIHMLI